MVDESLILRKISELEEYIDQLRELSSINLEEYLKDWKTQRAVERLLQISIETSIDIANHIISDKGWRIPVSYSDTFKVLNENGVIDYELFTMMEKMARFRNLIVHNYDRVDQTIVFNILKKNLEDFKRYKDYIIRWIRE